MSDNLPAAPATSLAPEAATLAVIRGMSPEARRLYAARFADATLAAYGSDLKAWEQEGISVPAEPGAIMETLTAWHSAGLSPRTLTRRAASLSTLHRAAGFRSPMESDFIVGFLKGIRKDAAKGPKRGRGKARAITPAELRRAVGEPVVLALPVQEIRRRVREHGRTGPIAETHQVQPDAAACAEVLRRARDRAMLLLGFCAALRRSEIVALDAGDITQDGARGLSVEIRRSKTDQEGEGATIAIPFGGLGTDTAEALEAWRILSGITSGPLFRGVDRHGNLAPVEVHALEPKTREPLYAENGEPIMRRNALTAEAANRIIQARAAEAGVDATGLSAHSLRAGYVTAQARRGTLEWRIQEVTRHRSAEVLRGYVRAATVMDRTPDLVLD